jgi:CheY-like chemotaxis protein
MAGEVEVESREGVGSTFRIKLPLPSSTGEMVMQDEVTTRAGLQGVRVLAVDDDPALARLLGRLLPSGTRLFDAGNARDGEEILLDHPEIELVFCDHELPGEQGLDFCTRMQESHYPQTRVLITGVTDTDFLHRALKSGAVDQVLSKPLDPSAIRKTFSEVMANRRGEDPTTGADAPDAVQIFHTELPILVAEDNKVNQLVARQYLQKLDLDCEVFPNGEEALEALKTGKYAAALMDLHMPRMDGLAATEAFRRWEEENGRPRLPVIALTADAIKGDREKCIKAGMDDYLSKPLRVADLTGVLRKFGLIRPAH